MLRCAILTTLIHLVQVRGQNHIHQYLLQFLLRHADMFSCVCVCVRMYIYVKLGTLLFYRLFLNALQSYSKDVVL